jgi:DNA modification methylase
VEQRLLFDWEPEVVGVRNRRSGSFIDNMRLPVHRWFRYSAGFSAEWVGQLIGEAASSRSFRVFDPFAGSGTVILEAERAGVEGIGAEAHPFIARVARTKLQWRENAKLLRLMGTKIVQIAEKDGGTVEDYAPLVAKCYPAETLEKLDSLKKAWVKSDDGSPAAELCWLALVSILRAASPVGTAQWQYILPKKAKARSVEPVWAFEERVSLFVADMTVWQERLAGPRGRILQEDARTCDSVADDWADLVITSPPYANNYDYADATRLEMTFLGEVNSWGDLQSTVREGLVRSCTQHVAPYAGRARGVLKEALLKSIAGELAEVCEKLEGEKENHGGKKQYHAMIAHYFLDLLTGA